MASAPRVFWAAVKDFWEELFMLALMNLVTTLLLVPVVTAPPALAGLWNAANLVTQGKSIAWSDYFEGFKRYFWKSWKLALVNIAVLGTLFVNLRFYAPGVTPLPISENVSFLIQMFWIMVGVLWIIMQMYPLAMLLEQTDQRVRLALRNAAVLLFAHPGFSLVLFILIFIVVAVSTVIPALWALVSFAFLAVVCNKAVRHLLVPYRERMQQELEQRAAAEAGEGEAQDDDSETDGEDSAVR